LDPRAEKILRAAGRASTNRFRSTGFDNPLGYQEEQIMPILLYIAMWSCALGMASSAMGPPPREERSDG
jgi:hypothetical protein